MKSRKQFMVDIETTGTSPTKDEILQIAIVEADFDGKFWQPGRMFSTFLHSSRQPISQFAKEHMESIYKAANESDVTPRGARSWILDFLNQCDPRADTWNRIFMGKAASWFDLPFLTHKHILVPPGKFTEPDTGIDILYGDFSHRIDDLSSRLSQAEDILKVDRRRLTEQAVEAYPEIALPDGLKSHDALYDCLYQLRTVNGLNRLLKVE